jgi:hypothetical protein
VQRRCPRCKAPSGTYQDGEEYSRAIDDQGLYFVMEGMDVNIFKIRFELRSEGHPPQAVSIPDDVTIIVANSMQPAARVGNEFFILTWIGSYVILRGEAAVFRIYNQQQQAIQPMV